MKPGYYLHANGSLIHKSYLETDELDESNLVVEWWYDSDIGTTAATYVAFLKEAKALGANDEEIYRLAYFNNLGAYISDWKTIVGVES